MAHSGWKPRSQRTVAVALALLGLATGAIGFRRSAGAALHGKGLVQGYGLLIGWLYFILIVAVAAVHQKWRRANTVLEPHSKGRRLYTATSAVLLAGMVLVPIALILIGHGDRNHYPTYIPNPPPESKPTQVMVGAPRKSSPFDLLPYVIALGVLLVIAAGVQLWRLYRRSAKVRLSVGPISGTEPSGPDQDEAAALADAMYAGRRALDGDDARAAIIACYAAMEESLAAAGVTRGHADSPAELLDRAVAGAVLRGPGPETLARLFREARFSTHRMGKDHLTAARDALEESTGQLPSDRTKQANRVVN